MSMRALVTGAGGFIGARAVTRLAFMGVTVRALVRHGVVGRQAGETLCERVRGDVTDRESLQRAASGCDVVFHCAWGGRTLDEQRQINVQGTRHLLEAAAGAGVRRVVHLSSMAVHGYQLPPVLSEDTPLNFRSDAYGISKAEGEAVAFERGLALGVEVVALRPTLVYGPRSPVWLLGYFERVKNEQVALIGGGAAPANLVYVDDLFDAMWLSATASGAVGEAFLISGTGSVPWREYLRYFARMCGKPLPPSVPLWRARLEVQWRRVYGKITQRPQRLRPVDLSLMGQHTVVSIEKARCMLGYAARISLDEGMRRCEAWLGQEGYLPPHSSRALTAEMGRARDARADSDRLSAVGE